MVKKKVSKKKTAKKKSTKKMTKAVKKSTKKSVKKQEIKAKKKTNVKALLSVLLVIVILAAIFALVKIAFNGFGSTTLDGELAARVNGQPITMEKLTSEYEKLPAYYQQIMTKEAYLEQLVNEELLLQYAIDAGVSVSDEEVEASLNDFFDQYNFTQEQFKEMLVKRNLSEEEVKILIRKQLFLDKVLDEQVKLKTVVSEEDALKYYQENTDTFKVPALVTARHILISTETRDEAKAEELANSIFESISPDKSNFCDLVTSNSEDPGSVENCGEYTFPRGQMVEEFENAAFSQEEGQISVVKTMFGYHIIWTVKKNPERIMSFQDVKEQIITSLTNQQEKQLYSAFLASLKENAKIKIYYESEPVEEPEGLVNETTGDIQVVQDGVEAETN